MKETQLRSLPIQMGTTSVGNSTWMAGYVEEKQADLRGHCKIIKLDD